MSKKLQCQDCSRAEYGEDLYNYDGKILCRYCIVSRLYEGLTLCEYVGICNDETFSNKTEQINQLQQQLAEKDKEIEKLKTLVRNLNHEAQKYYEDAYCNGYNKQLAIKELEKAKHTIKHFCNIHSDEYYGVKSQVKGIEQDTCDQINNQIKELKGE